MVDRHCPFCRILIGDLQTTILYHDDLVTAFPDYSPIAPVHVLIIPNKHLESVNAVTPADEPILGRMLTVANQLAIEHGVNGTGYRLVINTGRNARQSVMHLHMHLIGGTLLPARLGNQDS